MQEAFILLLPPPLDPIGDSVNTEGAQGEDAPFTCLMVNTRDIRTDGSARSLT
jgi:hypothetical protein